MGRWGVRGIRDRRPVLYSVTGEKKSRPGWVTPVLSLMAAIDVVYYGRQHYSIYTQTVNVYEAGNCIDYRHVNISSR
jgi:hypothetical protein